MGYLRLQDYFNFRIQEAQLNQITQGNDFVRTSCELEAQAETVSYLVQKYDVEDEFINISTYAQGKTYKANNLQELNADAYDASSTYVLNSLTLQNGKVYICSTAIVTSETFNPAHWTLVGNQYDLVYVSSPYPRYSYKVTYQVGDIVFYKDKTYKCIVSHTNIMPTDLNQGAYYWSSGISYSFTGVEPYQQPSDFTAWSNLTTYNAGDKANYQGVIYQSISTNTNETPGNNFLNWQPITFVFGDNRSTQIVAFMIDMVLYKIHMRIAPNNIPKLRLDSYTYALDWLKEAGGQNNAITANIPLLQPKQGGRIRWGSNIKNINNY